AVPERGVEERAACAPRDAQPFAYRTPSGRAVAVAASRVPELSIGLAEGARAIAVRVPPMAPAFVEAWVVEVVPAARDAGAVRAFVAERETCNASVHVGERVVGIGELRASSDGRLPGGTFASRAEVEAALGAIPIEVAALSGEELRAIASAAVERAGDVIRRVACDARALRAFERDEPAAFAQLRGALDAVDCAAGEARAP
ncbi:MAG: hypothetical protein KC560_14130, partial [Myxococcales bacterium]|nr:hypothetical protein [Myxococcales bacterium]